jgi:uncharacterized protein (DUF433 family)
VTHPQPRAYKSYRWIIADPEWLGGKPAIRGTRLSVAQILECLSAGMTLADINEAFGGGVPADAIPEALAVGAELADKPCVAA